MGVVDEKEKRRLRYIDSLTITAKSDNETVKRRMTEVADMRRRERYESLLSAQKRVRDYERHMVRSRAELSIEVHHGPQTGTARKSRAQGTEGEGTI